ncbi:MAG: YbaB/EbfC family nucleoid-associated protein [Actinobacteria bacterium]|nr:YbaB/EbfC family nucleoid-associated protein [Actinomycetota bacterium]
MAQQPNLNKMMQQLQKAQTEMMAAQDKLKDEVVEASAGGGMVTVKVSGDLQILDVKIDPAALDPEDAEILQDMVLAAVNEALRSAQQLAEQRLGGIAGGLGLPGM